MTELLRFTFVPMAFILIHVSYANVAVNPVPKLAAVATLKGNSPVTGVVHFEQIVSAYDATQRYPVHIYGELTGKKFWRILKA